MKLDKIEFASLIGYISCRYALTLTQDDMREMDELIDIDQPQPDMVYPSVLDINYLMALMAAGDAAFMAGSPSPKIEAIKLHRKLTGWGLKESRDQVEKYWISKDMSGGPKLHDPSKPYDLNLNSH